MCIYKLKIVASLLFNVNNGKKNNLLQNHQNKTHSLNAYCIVFPYRPGAMILFIGF